MASDIFEKTIRIRSEFVNQQRILRTSSLFRLLQEASIAHTEALGMGRDKTLDRGLLWVLSHQCMSVDAMPSYDDEIVLRSWPGNMLHVFFPRFYEVFRNGERIMHGEALWLLIDEASRTMAFPAEHGVVIPGAEGTPESSCAQAIRAPKDSVFAFESDYRARFSQIDINGHINNANYFDLVDDLLPASLLLTSYPKDIRAEYLTEIRPDTEIRIRGYEAAGRRWYVEGIRKEDSETVSGTPSPAARPFFRFQIQY